ncbi:hypothetical protein [Streptomyces cyaneofuscatus]|uniref:hypothetical protein n=1 Tax=Streptomyces cyaneofuscatus TaxID=66883 RepID=UPI00364DF366
MNRSRVCLTLYAKFRYPPVLLIVCRDKGTAEWAAEPIRIGLEKHPSLAVFPLVLGPHNVPMITDAARAADDLPMAVFSAITHSHDHDIAAILDALAEALPGHGRRRRSGLRRIHRSGPGRYPGP